MQLINAVSQTSEAPGCPCLHVPDIVIYTETASAELYAFLDLQILSLIAVYVLFRLHYDLALK